MLKKSPFVNPKEPNRLWYSSDYFDLIVWKNQESSVEAFGLYYDTKKRERVLTWRRGQGFSHAQIDSGEQNPTFNRSPLLVPDGVFDKAKILDRFQYESQTIDSDIREFIIQKLTTYH
ncbi:MAG: hypothetical protein KU38_04855 [Sulfurovum sp. FS08-3]|nr:MAG: hypothetical protein KU38_04855 [Sulfurovum sp. FS08-3]